uniref:Reverse transcriptase n=1 Tax=Fagus sylvatica TaxID=28930 RepID=A0A2N9GGN7_FAGSY
MEGAPNDGTSADPAMTPIERQMQVIATSIQDLARETSRQNQELWQAIRKGPPTPRDNNQPPPRGGNRSNDQEADSHQVTRRRDGEIERTPPRSRNRAESAGSSAPPSQHKTTRSSKQTERPDRSSKQPERLDRSSRQPERENRRGSPSKRPDRPEQSSRDPDDKTARLEKELREMRKQMGDMKNSLRAKAARNLDNLVHRADSPFIPSIADFPLPSRFKVPLLENFDGTKDPFDYLEAFKTVMQLQAVPEEVMCRAFPLGLRGSARVWFNKLESESIGSFVQLSRAFIDHFIGSQRRGRPPTHLLSVKQMEGESLRTFVHRFNEEAMKIDRPKEDVTVTAFMAGLRKGDFLYELCKDPLETMSEFMYEATKHMNAEDALEAMEDPPPKRRKEAENHKPEPAKQKVPKFTETPERKRTTAPPVKFSSFTPLNTPIDKLLLQIQDDPSLRWPAKPPTPREQAEHNRPGPVGEIRTIVGGPASGGTSKASRKAYARQIHNIMVVQRPPKNIRLDDQIISFSEEDARGTHQPHDDALVITINIAGFTTRRVMVDNGSSADILYLPAYQQMRLDKDKLRPMDAPLVGFTGDKVCPVGIVTLPITVGTHPKTVSKTVNFLVVNCPSAYNAIIGRPTLNRLRAVTSTYHLLLKFPTEHGIGEVRGDQIAARECYLASLGSGGQNQTMSIEEQKILVKPSGELDTVELEDGRPERTTKVGADLPPEMKESLVQFLKDNKDVFAWSHEDMPGINPSIISHKLNVDPSLRPIKQKQRVFALERNKAIMEEVDKLLAANFIREVYYPDWLANVVMVKKSTGKWRMCVDFTDLNKACPKDSFPLPRIDQLVDSTAGHKLLTFMDAFSGYNQIVMDEDDQEKTSFITSRGLFCYKVMPFGLKNAGATYQRLMNRMFHDQIGRNVEVYVDNMLVKSKEEDDHLDDLRETFQTLRKYQMKLNPSKCAFGVYSGKFLGFMVSQRGIEANPDKIKAILEMQPPKNTKERPKTDRKSSCIESAFEWTDECQRAFEELKKYLTTPPLLSPSKQGEELYLYLAVSPTAVSSALIREEERRQLPVYYTSRALRGAEERYPPMEKLAFALVTAARKLRPYFQAHTIVLFTNHPLRIAMNKPDAAGRLIQWSIELSEFDIDYRPRTAIKAQALADFIAEFTSKDDEPTEDVERTLRCLAPDEAKLRYEEKIHEGVCGDHSGARALQRKIVRAGYYWPSMKADACQFVQRCDKCQRFANLLHSPPTELVPMTAPWPFAQWGLDIMGPLPIGRRQLKFGIPRVLVSDNGKQFDNPRFRQFSQELGIHNHYSSPGHPQANGQVEVTNRSLLKLIKTRLEGAKGLWPEELPSILWAYRTTVRIPTGETPFRMTFGSEAVIPVEIGMTTFRTSAYDGQKNEEQLRLNLDLIDEVRETAETRMKRYQEKMARHYNSRVKPRQLSIGDLVLRKVTLATRNPSEGKLGPNWEGPYKIIEVRRPGTYHLEDMNGRRLSHPWNAEHLRRYYP